MPRPPKRVWTEAEKKFIRDNAPILKDEELAAALSRITGEYISVHNLRQARYRLGIQKKRGHGVCEVVEDEDVHPEG